MHSGVRLGLTWKSQRISMVILWWQINKTWRWSFSTTQCIQHRQLLWTVAPVTLKEWLASRHPTSSFLGPKKICSANIKTFRDYKEWLLSVIQISWTYTRTVFPRSLKILLSQTNRHKVSSRLSRKSLVAKTVSYALSVLENPAKERIGRSA